MKLLLCPECQDVFNLKVRQAKKCSCGRTVGVYLNESYAIFCGGVPLGFANSSLVDAVRNRPDLDDGNYTGGREFKAFVIPRLCETMEERSREALELWLLVSEKESGT